ncbi:MAG: YgaP family membrane protein [Nocardioides sp.]
MADLHSNPLREAMSVDRAVLAMAGTVILVSVLLSAVVSQWWLLLSAFVGLNLLQSSITGFCPAALVFRRLGLPSGCAFR